MLTIGIEDELFERAMARAKARGESLEAFLQAAIDTHLARTDPGQRAPLRLVPNEPTRLFDDDEVAHLLEGSR